MLSASCSTQAPPSTPPSPRRHYVIISSTPSLPLSSPFTEQTHNKTHSVTLCVFHTITPGSRWAGNPLSLRPQSPPPLLAPPPSPPRGTGASGRFCDWAILRSNGATHSRSAGGGIRGNVHHLLLAAPDPHKAHARPPIATSPAFFFLSKEKHLSEYDQQIFRLFLC